MPASTTGFECLFEVENDTDTLLYISSGGVTTSVDPGGDVSLVLCSGSTYCYTVKQGQHVAKIMYVCHSFDLEVQISGSVHSRVKLWQDTRCKASTILVGSLERTSTEMCGIVCSRGATGPT